jgi:hypothetical protein
MLLHCGTVSDTPTLPHSKRSNVLQETASPESNTPHPPVAHNGVA